MKLKESYIKILVIVTILGMFVFGMAFAAGEPGTSSDPIVSQSYVDSKVLFQGKDVAAGKKIVLKKGSEFVLSSGDARAENGTIINVSTGKTIASGAQVPANNVIVSTTDDSVITIVSASKILVKGHYVIQ